MKKLFVALCAVAMVAMVACKKGDPTPDNPSDNPTQQRDLREGAYDPVCKISGITYSDGSDSEVWTWENGKLQRVNNDVLFTYGSDGRVSQVELQNIETGGLLPGANLSGTMKVNYSGDYISSLTVVNSGTELMTAQVEHNSANKVSGATLDLSSNMLVDVFNSLLVQFLGDSAGSDNMVTGVDNVSGNVLFTWDGDNVSQAMMNIGFRVATTLGTLVDLIGEDNLDMFGENGSMLALAAALMPNQPLYFNVSVGDTVLYTYDSHANPYRHYLGRVHISTLSANNLLTEQHLGNAHVTITTTLAGQTTQIYETDYPLPLGASVNEYLEYNDADCPLRFVDIDGVETTIQYKE